MPATTPPDATSASPAFTQQIGHYHFVAKIGEGGMGVVYRARDTRLNREVAIKVLPRAFAEDPLRMARFEREAQLLASLNHPKIAAIYGLEESGATRALVMELVEGPTLAERIGRASARPKAPSASPAQASGGAGSGAKTSARSGAKSGSGACGVRKAAIPNDEALPIAQQVAEALEYAHEHGVVHRDLKPANIKITPNGDVKVLDFGLAKAMGPADASGDMSNSPTLSLAMTEAGLIIGTAAYMAPEQAKGRPVDRRADVWAFGCVLYEMLSGQKAFDGETVSDVLAAVIMKEPDWDAISVDTPPTIRRLVRRCLAKDPKQRLHDMGDARLAIEETLSGADQEAAVSGSPIPVSKRASVLCRALPWALGAVAVISTTFATWMVLRSNPRQNVTRFPVSPPENAELVDGGMMSISPDGRTLAFAALLKEGNYPVLWLRPLDSLTSRPIPGVEGVWPFWSPDSQEIGFYANGKLEKVAASGGVPLTLCDATGAGATWNRNGVILFTNNGILYRVPDTGGTPTLVLAPDKAHHGGRYRFPQFLPDGQHFLFQIGTGTPGEFFVAAGSLDSKKVDRLAQVGSDAFYAPPGDVFYLNQNTLMARPFDAKALHFTGPAAPVAQNVGSLTGPGYAYFSVSAAGLLAYHVTEDTGANQISWFNRAGQNVGTAGQPDLYSSPVLSPDGTRLAASVGGIGKRDIWVYDLKRGTGSRLTFNPADDLNPVWSADGTRIVFTSNRDGQYDLYQKDADGLGRIQPVFQSKQSKHLDDLSPDGRYVIYDTYTPGAPTELWALPLFGDRKPFVFVQDGFEAREAQFAPSSRFVAYTSYETGRAEIYVQTFPQRTGKWQISASGGREPKWAHNGRELFYLSLDKKLMSVDVNTDSAGFHAGIPKELFQSQVSLGWGRNNYVVSRDGQKFLMIVPPGHVMPEPITVVVNWPELLKK